MMINAMLARNAAAMVHFDALQIRRLPLPDKQLTAILHDFDCLRQAFRCRSGGLTAPVRRGLFSGQNRLEITENKDELSK
jgi:hypothetical protein